MSKVILMLRDMGKLQGNRFALKLSCGLLVVAAILTGLAFVSYSEDVNKGLAENLVRLHVIANSDSNRDQALKQNVRDAVISYMKDQLSQSKNIQQTKQIVDNNLLKIEEIAREEIARYGESYEVQVLFGNYPFPTKVYGDVTLPAGEYNALRIVIGKGEGANWWCVLFPPLCFVDATHGTVPDSVKQDLRNVLTEEEYKIILAAENDEDIPVKIKFKVVEFLQGSKIKFTGLMSRIWN